MHTEKSAIFAGLIGIHIPVKSIDLECGVKIEQADMTFVRVMAVQSPAMKADIYPMEQIQRPKGHPVTYHVTAQIVVPHDVAETDLERKSIARFLVLLMHIYCDPKIRFFALCNCPFVYADGATLKLELVEHMERYFEVWADDQAKGLKEFTTVASEWGKIYQLYRTSEKFKRAVLALNEGFYLNNGSSFMVLLWGCLESIFSNHRAELKFRVSAMIASYLVPLGEERLRLQKHISKLYDARSGAAHGNELTSAEDPGATWMILRDIVTRIIKDNKVPSESDLQRLLFGVS